MTSSATSLHGIFATKAEALLIAIPEYTRTSYTLLANQIRPKFLIALQKTKELWIRTLPYVKASLIFCSTPLGISIIVLCTSIIPLRLSRSTKSNIKSISWLALGILIASCGGILLTNAIPSLVFKTITHVS